MSKYNPQQLYVLQRAADGDKPIFTPEEFQSLVEGNPTMKVSYRADKIIQDYERRLKAPVSRQEAYSAFLPVEAHKHFATQEFAPRINYLFDVVSVLKAKGLLTDEEITAEGWPNLCETCGRTFPECAGEPKRAGDAYKDLPDSLAGKVIECKTFEAKKAEAAND